MAQNEIEKDEQFDIEVEELDTVSGGAASSLMCMACPVSCFSSVVLESE
ncbi:hypothetical protein ACFYS8_09875 [Kitasatospora sp. NPDC004615]